MRRNLFKFARTEGPKPKTYVQIPGMLKVINVVGARPNFMKVAPIVAAMKARPEKFQPLVVHTGQHYDADMSDSFFRDLQLPQPDTHLGVGSGSHAAQTAAVMERFEPVVLREKPDWVLVVNEGTVNNAVGVPVNQAAISAPLNSWPNDDMRMV